ncbi:hypothetical protein C8A00DRAFT_35726 [Chaetomidium leptoderma]|uniref:Uncharacterized protein n=1 Tax=Chaetomidium leptoderma TaxID=669021 RepID=A0AAN6VHI3_9PEZI|nr:hypothetical protein C8A00DRAFT_35726 [Chaetomidium leptoderma]
MSPPPTPFTKLPNGYEIRQLEPKHAKWIQAIAGHTMSFDSPIWCQVGDVKDRTKRAYQMYEASGPSSELCTQDLASYDLGIEGSLSYGVFLKGHKCNDPEKEGELKWDLDNPFATREDLLNQMDFPLVSIAMSKDAAIKKSQHPTGLKTWAEIVDGHKDISEQLKEGDDRDQSVWAPNIPGKVVHRCGTHTRSDHAGKGLSKALAHFVMQKMADLGYEAILIHTGSEAVNKVWEYPPEPFKSKVIHTFNTDGFRKENAETKEEYCPFGEKTDNVACKRIWIELPKKGEEKE